MIKRFSKSICFLCAIIIIITGCVRQQDESNAETKGSENEIKREYEDKVVVYATHPEALLERVSTAFTEKTGIPVEYVSLKGDLTDRMRQEKENVRADVMYGGASTLYIALRNEGLLEPYVPSWAKNVKEEYIDSKSHWYGAMKTPIVIFYNTDLLKEDQVPKSWKELADPKYKGMIVSRDSNSSSQQATIVSLLSYYEKENGFESGVEWLKKLDENTVKYCSSNESHFQSLYQKEAPISYGVLSSVIDSKIKDGIPFDIVKPKEGSIVLTDCIGLVKNAPHPNAAKAFIEFVGSKEAQIMLANEFDRMPMVDEARIEGPAWMHEDIPAMSLDWEYIAKHEYDWNKMWEEQIRDSKKSNE